VSSKKPVQHTGTAFEEKIACNSKNTELMKVFFIQNKAWHFLKNGKTQFSILKGHSHEIDF
jgi:hypothetical protein